MKSETIDVSGLHYKILNEKIHRAINKGTKKIILNNVGGQRFIADGIGGKIKIVINGVPGNDLGAFMDGPEILVNSNAEDGIGNTMNGGKIIIDGNTGDIVGHSMRGGKIFIKGNAGYRVGIHMKSYQDLYPVVIIGGIARDFLGEYMAGGLLIILGINKKKEESIVGNYVGTGMHGGTIYIRGKIEAYQLGKEANILELDSKDRKQLKIYLEEYAQDFHLNLSQILKEKFLKLVPSTTRPYGKLYAY